jgi:transcriptional regulator with XRE-family HTH domain
MLPKIKHPNDLAAYRKRMRLTQAQVARLLGHKTHKSLSRLELGRALPSLKTALRLAVVYRIPVDFLFHNLYVRFREEIRQKERRPLEQHQGVLALD